MEPAGTEPGAHRLRLSVHAARRAETIRIPGPPARRVRIVVPLGYGRHPRVVWRRLTSVGTVYPPRCIRVVRVDGVRLFHRACPAKLLAVAEWRGAGDHVLLRVLVPRLRGWWKLEPR